MSPKAHTVLIVDDTLENLRVLGEMLESDGHEVRIASQGVQALEMVRLSPPDLILLDVMMPGMTGHEVCRQLKADPSTAPIPVIFLTALTDEADEALGLDLGAVDYISKPFKMDLVKKRIHNHLALAQLQSALEDLVAVRTRELIEANERLRVLNATKTRFLRLLSQEVQGPANGLVGIGRLALLAIEEPSKKERLTRLFQEGQGRLEKILNLYQQLVSLREGDRPPPPRPVRWEECLQQGWAGLSAPAGAKNLELPAPPARSYIVAGDPAILTEAFGSLLGSLVAVAEAGGRLSDHWDETEQSVVWAAQGSLEGRRTRPRDSLETWEGAGAWNLTLSAILVGTLGGTVALGSEPAGWDLRVTLPRYGRD